MNSLGDRPTEIWRGEVEYGLTPRSEDVLHSLDEAFDSFLAALPGSAPLSDVQVVEAINHACWRRW
ncbi:hypothetical protein ACFFV7_38905 [Nonomuraea spiralis]|uniref:Uncharacterized protein n=1 Tax=Nonomuraea spiralis TaxID=46182 RepID=A0ABV5IRP5_9ACTN|nr:hypothetical protein [Nonomuraea spiralis]GGT45936.1 hypothetical protein GCM10010176_106360 [Nonomuraea spiralis]